MLFPALLYFLLLYSPDCLAAGGAAAPAKSTFAQLWQIAIAVLGGVGFLIFGMSQMSDGLRDAAGEKLKNLLRLFTKNRVSALVAGAVVTAGVQSSAAVTVMVTGFINAGLLTLRQSLGIIFGANIGTTVTAQIISFDIAGAALPAVALGVLFGFSKRRAIYSHSRLGQERCEYR